MYQYRDYQKHKLSLKAACEKYGYEYVWFGYVATERVKRELPHVSKITIEENSIIAPYALSNGETWFAFGSANSDGISHFKSFGTNSFGLEDLNGGGDKDYDDFIVKFDFNSVTA